jgi:hypothetical protein
MAVGALYASGGIPPTGYYGVTHRKRAFFFLKNPGRVHMLTLKIRAEKASGNMQTDFVTHHRTLLKSPNVLCIIVMQTGPECAFHERMRP